MNGTPLWKQYGFASEAEFNKRYPEVLEKQTQQAKLKQPPKRRKRKSRVMPRH